MKLLAPVSLALLTALASTAACTSGATADCSNKALCEVLPDDSAAPPGQDSGVDSSVGMDSGSGMDSFVADSPDETGDDASDSGGDGPHLEGGKDTGAKDTGAKDSGHKDSGGKG